MSTCNVYAPYRNCSIQFWFPEVKSRFSLALSLHHFSNMILVVGEKEDFQYSPFKLLRFLWLNHSKEVYINAVFQRMILYQKLSPDPKKIKD